MCARAGSTTSRGWSVLSDAQSRNDDRKPCGTASIPSLATIFETTEASIRLPRTLVNTSSWGCGDGRSCSAPLGHAAKKGGFKEEIFAALEAAVKADRKAELDAGRLRDLVAALRTHAETPEARQCIQYIVGNRHRMRYLEFRARGLCVASGVVEAGCKQIGARLKRTGMRAAASSAAALRTSGSDEPRRPPDAIQQ